MYVTHDTESGGGLANAMFVPGDTAVERRVGRLGVPYDQLAGAGAVRRCVNPRVIDDINTVSLPSTHSSTSCGCRRQ